MKHNISGTRIPWQKKSELDQIRLAFEMLEKKYPEKQQGLREKAARIVKAYEAFSEIMSPVCDLTCPHCIDVCCKRATIWYDLKDLLAVYFGTGFFPEQQIKRKRSYSDASCVCSCLGEKGCRLPRAHRPFVCSWYLCPEQTSYLLENAPELKLSLEKSLNQIRSLRNQLDELFIQAVSV